MSSVGSLSLVPDFLSVEQLSSLNHLAGNSGRMTMATLEAQLPPATGLLPLPAGIHQTVHPPPPRRYRSCGPLPPSQPSRGPGARCFTALLPPVQRETVWPPFQANPFPPYSRNLCLQCIGRRRRADVAAAFTCEQ